MLKPDGLRSAIGDQYAAGFSRSVYSAAGISLMDATGTRADAYLHLLPLMTQGRVELPPDPTLRIELMGLQRRVRSGGRDVIDHRPGAHDDLSNAVALGAWSALQHAASNDNQCVVIYSEVSSEMERMLF